jgi:hypothetical protein
MGVVRVVGSRKCTWESGNGTNKISLRARGSDQLRREDNYVTCPISVRNAIMPCKALCGSISGLSQFKACFAFVHNSKHISINL